MQRLLSQIIPFLIVGLVLVALAFGFILLMYLFLFGALIGLTLFVVSWIKNKFFPKKPLPSTKTRRGRIIDSDDWKEL